MNIRGLTRGLATLPQRWIQEPLVVRDILNSFNPVSNKSSWHLSMMQTTTYLPRMRNMSRKHGEIYQPKKNYLLDSWRPLTQFNDLHAVSQSTVALSADIKTEPRPPGVVLWTYWTTWWLQRHLHLQQLINGRWVHRDVTMNIRNCHTSQLLPILTGISIWNRTQAEQDSVQTMAQSKCRFCFPYSVHATIQLNNPWIWHLYCAEYTNRKLESMTTTLQYTVNKW